MTIIEAKKIGRKQAIISVIIGLSIAQGIMTYMMSIDRGFSRSFFWFIGNEYLGNIIIGIFILFINAYYLGQLAGKIILIKKKNSFLIGVLFGLMILIFTAFITSMVGYIQVILTSEYSNDNLFKDYVIKPIYWISVFGFIPVLFIGLWFGRSIGKKGRIK